MLAGHVDWSGEGPGALYYIGQLVVGDPIEVIGSNRETTYWRVSEPPITISKAALPADLFVNTWAGQARPRHLWRAVRRGYGPLPGQRRRLGHAGDALTGGAPRVALDYFLRRFLHINRPK